MNSNIVNPHWFEFHEWEKAFETVKQLRSDGQDVILKISTHQYTSGYWVEPPTRTVLKGTFVYDTDEKIDDLEARVRKSARLTKTVKLIV